MWQEIILGHWYSFNPNMFLVQMEKNRFNGYKFSISTEIETLTGVTRRDDCIYNFIQNLDCSRICSPLSFNYLNITPCSSNSEASCMEDQVKDLKSKEMQLCRFVLPFVRQYLFVMIVVGIVALAEHCFVYKHAT